MLNRDLSGFSDATLTVVFANGAKHFDEQGYDGPLVVSEDATCICPTAEKYVKRRQNRVQWP
eukprot:4888732-Prymnesium_polylepis.1